MKLEILDKSEYITAIFNVEDDKGKEYFVRFMEDPDTPSLSWGSVEVESVEEGYLDPKDPRHKKLVKFCEKRFGFGER